MAMKRFNDGGKPEEFAGNNCFHLNTFNDSGETITLTGVLKEMPSFGLSTEWMEAPKATFGKKIQEFFMSDLVNTAAFLAGAVNTSQLLSDDWSTRMYTGTSNKDITLNFRIYPQNPLGQTSPEDWLKYLSAYATPNSKSTMRIETLEENIDKALKGLKDKGEQYGEYANALTNFMSNTEGDNETPENQKKRKENIAYILNKMPNYLSQAIATKSAEFKTDMKIDDWTGDADNKKAKQISVTDIINGVKISLKNLKKHNADTIKLDKAEQFNFEVEWATRKGGTSSEVIDCDTFDMTKCLLNVSEIIGKLQEQDSDFNDELVVGQSKEHPIVINYIESVLNDINTQIINDGKDFDANLGVLKNAGSDFVKGIESTLATRFADENRWNNVDFLAERLWALDLYRFIFKKPIIVAITDWKVTPSLEIMDGKHAYYDFSITCRPDQIKSLDRWKQVIKYEAQPEVN